MRTPQAAAPDRGPGPVPPTAFLQPVGIGMLIVPGFVATYLAALHRPQPKALPVGVVAAPGVVAQLQHAISARAGDAVALRPIGDAASAHRQVEQGRIVAAYLPGHDGHDRMLLVAGAQGAAVTQTVSGIFAAATATNAQASAPAGNAQGGSAQGGVQGQGAALQVEDVVPLSTEDPRGFSAFYVVFGVTLAGFIFGQTSHLYTKRLPGGRKLLQALLFALLAGLAGALLAGPLFGVLPGPWPALGGILALLALATALVTMAFTALLGDPGIVLATLLLVILGNATSGGVVPASFMPSGFRQLSLALPPGAAVRAVGRVGYFDPAAALPPIAVMAAWAAGAVMLVLVAGGRRFKDAPPRAHQDPDQRSPAGRGRLRGGHRPART